MAGERYQVGDLVTLSASWDFFGTPTDPTGITFQTKDPNGNVLSYTFGSNPNVTRYETGVYLCTVTVGLSGLWNWRAQGTGAIQKNNQDELYRRPERVLTPSSLLTPPSCVV